MTTKNQKPLEPRGSATYEYLVYLIKKRIKPDILIGHEINKYNGRLNIEEHLKLREVLKEIRPRVSKIMYPQDW